MSGLVTRLSSRASDCVRRHNAVLRSGADVLIVPLTLGFTTLVDLADDWVLEHRWCAMVCGNGQLPYARRSYAADRASGRGDALHRLLLGPRCNGFDVDHINGDSLDNRRGNLRVASRLMNARNVAPSARAGRSGVAGVTWDGDRQIWRVLIKVNGKRHNIGRFRGLDEAISARAKAERGLWGIEPRRAEFIGRHAPAE